MHLTLACLQMRGSWKGALFMSGVLLVAACSRRADPPVPTPVPVPVEPPAPIAEARTLLVLAPDSTTYDAYSTVVTVERSGTEHLTDSITYSESIQATLTADGAPRFRLMLRSDSGYRLPTDRQPPPETVRKDSSAVTSFQLLGGDERGELAVRNGETACSSKLSLVSPLLTSAIARYLLAASTITPARRTSLQYNTCSAGVLRTVSGFLEHEVEQRTNERSGASLALEAQISADSSRALPMRIVGTMKGRVTALPGADTSVLPSRVELRMISDISASSSSKSQQFEQRVTTLLVRRN